MSEAATISDAHGAEDNETIERLRQAVDAATSWEVVHRPRAAGHFPKRVAAARAALEQLEGILARQSVTEVPSDPGLVSRRAALLELGASYRLLRTAITAVSDRPREIASLPRLVPASGQDEPRVAAIARAYFCAANGEFSANTFNFFIHALQAHEPLNVGELWSIGPFFRFAWLERILDEANKLLDPRGRTPAPLLLAYLKSLRSMSNADWPFLIEPLIAVDAFLRQDPAKTFENMDFESRELYRKRIALVARRSDCTEMQVAQAALELAQQGRELPSTDARIQRKHTHVGYYLIGKGFPRLAERVGFHPDLAWRMRGFVREHGEDFFLSGIQLLTLFFVAAALFPVVPAISSLASLATAIILLLFPATQAAVDLLNNAITAFFDPEPLPKLDFSHGIPKESATLVVVPSLLVNEKQAHKLIDDLEVRFLANRGRNLHFALLTDLADSAAKPRDNDAHPLVDLAVRLVGELNAKYQPLGMGGFLLLHRHRIFNTRQGVWMGWERKRGKLLDLNQLLAGQYDAFPIKAGRIDALAQIRYIFTLDADSQLPHGTAARLAGAIAHPLNQAIIDPRLRIVTAGFGILQPRIGVSVPSAARSWLASIYSGQNGFDIYTRAISDAYQDLFDEGIYTGKGIYEVATLHAVLDRRFPRNSLLSHDLIEGAYARAGLASDIELIDDYPSHLSAYVRRKHRWVRGDWQIAQWMFSRVPDESGQRTRNPISNISRWKIFDNLRRSLVDPFLFLLFVAGWLGLPGGPLYWTIASLVLLVFPALAQLGFGIGRAFLSGRKGQAGEVAAGFWHAALVALLRLVFLPHETLLAFDAIVRSLVRRFITGERLLEWETAAQTEMQSSARATIDRYLAILPGAILLLAAIPWFAAPHRWTAIACATPILMLWALSNPMTLWLNRAPHLRPRLAPSDENFLAEHALLIWRYFHQFSSERHNYLIPDNVMDEGLREAARVSPTNIGLLLNTRQAACELGFLTIPEFVDGTMRTLGTVARLEKFRGHIYNWYDTETLRPLGDAPFISSVDSGNFAASLYTLHAGVRSLARQPLLGPQLFFGIRTHMRLLRKERSLPPGLSRLPLPDLNDAPAEWIDWLTAAHALLDTAGAATIARQRDGWWQAETLRRIEAILLLLKNYFPWELPQFAALRTSPQIAPNQASASLTCGSALISAEKLQIALSAALPSLNGSGNLTALAQELLTLLPDTIHNLRNLSAQLRSIEEIAERLAQEMDFAFLANSHRQILSIGYEPAKGQLHESCYDMVASEARLATFLAIARGDLPQRGWYKLGRDHTCAYGRFLLLSWSGTMFEYLMPALWMRSYPGTMIDRTQKAAVHTQRAFTRGLRIPWGISESGSARINESGDYHYFAYGIPRLALWFEATAGPVISPYSSFLALPIDPLEALRNLRRMKAMRWVGAFGFYESADFTGSLRDPELTREWMAHHQGMSLLAIVNLLRGNLFERWFHAHPLIKSAELLLQEIPVNRAVLKAQLKELAPLRRPFRPSIASLKPALRRTPGNFSLQSTKPRAFLRMFFRLHSGH
jgi:cyclic beta-1,2-glucan synthetase